MGGFILTESGPGVGVGNNEVKFDAEMVRIFQSDYQVRLHRALRHSG